MSCSPARAARARTSFAHLIHELSSGARAPFVVVDCGALPETLARERDLRPRAGRVHRRRRSAAPASSRSPTAARCSSTRSATPPPSLQAKLLRAIETKTFDRLGGRAPVQVDVRIVAATNRDLRRGRRGLPRGPLLPARRLHIAVPPLRERAEDVPELVEAFIGKIALQQHREGTPRHGQREALARCAHYRWPGNVRELRNVDRARGAARAAAIDLEHLPLEITLSADSGADDETGDAAGTATGAAPGTASGAAVAQGTTLKDAREHDHRPPSGGCSSRRCSATGATSGRSPGSLKSTRRPSTGC